MIFFRKSGVPWQVTSPVTDLSNSSFIVSQTQQEDAGLVHLDGHRASSPLHLTHGGSLLGSCLSDQRLSGKKKKELIQHFLLQTN